MTALADLDLTTGFATALSELVLPAELFRASEHRNPRPTVDLPASLAALEPDLPPDGHVLDKYLLERPIGVGGFAIVYRARHQLLDAVFALKLLRPSLLRRRPALAQALGDEARMAARIHHPNVVRVVDVTVNGPGAGYSYIVMEYVAGPDLSAMLHHKGALPPRMVLKIVMHVAMALAAGLDQQLVHRDIKPSNILLTPEGVTKLVDFGLARSPAISGDLRHVVGTLGYMSPEHIEQPRAVDHRSDIFSLGATAYHAMTGQLPTRGATLAESLAALRRPIAPPHRIASRVGAPASDLVMWMLEPDPARRPQDHQAVIDAARRALAQR